MFWDALFSERRAFFVSASSDGNCSTTRRFKGVLKRLAAVALLEVLKLLCDLYQYDLLM